MRDFSCLSLTPIELAHTGLAVATARAGGVALLDVEFCRESDLAQAESNLKRLLELVSHDAPVGLRLRADQLGARGQWLERLAARPHWLILAGWEGMALPTLKASLPPSDARTLLLEVTDAAQLDALASDADIDGLVARGHESGGWVGEDSAFILTQKLLARQSRPVYVQGGMGLHSAASCRAVGAAGVVLDDQLWLMPESPLPAAWQTLLGKLSGQEAVLTGERLGAGCRILARPGLKAAAELQQYADHAELKQGMGDASGPPSARWRARAQSVLGWGAPELRAWPVGQAVGLAEGLCRKYKTTGRLVQAMLTATGQQVALARRLQPLRPDGPLAASHGTRFPIVQGPMTRVSDTAPFAASVARAGALPLLALAMMKGDEVKPLLEETRKQVGGLPWGVGILGFVPQELREQQLKAVCEVMPPFALIAGGRPDQSAQLEALGIATYIHVPTAGLLKSFYAKGARRFVFEGRECGGHIGPLTSFMLWESMIKALLEEVAPGDAAGVHLLFAGGIHDARSAAMVGVMAAPLVERGMRIGVLMGTAYLFTEEAVMHGAIVPGFQEQALACERTTTLESGPGHAIRCVATPFTREFYSVRRRAANSGHSSSELKEALESLVTGRLRLASKGLQREGDRLVSVAGERQLEQGMYMIGQVATIQNSVRGMEELHREVAEGSVNLLIEEPALCVELMDEHAPAKPSEVAIIGIATLLPGAQDAEGFWTNVLRKVDSITEIPPEHWDWRLYYDPERKARDKSYSKWGGFIADVPFDPLRFGIPPNSLKSISCSQLITLECVRRALDDAGYAAGDFDRERTSVILGTSEGAGMLGNQYVARTILPLCVDAPLGQVWERLPEWTEESFPGTLANVIAGRVANRLDLGGSNYTVDAACASSLMAVDLALGELESGRSSMVITGGIDIGQSPYSYVAFSKTHALSPKGRTRTFDKSADGIVISEGIVILILKRLADAERDGDRIYAVLKGVAGSSDGKGLGMTAPRPLGQVRAVERAYKKAGIKLSTIGYYEAHGTGTAVGDRAELETIITSLKADEAASKSCAIGSVKTLIGHTKTAAGVVGLTKAALALYHKTLPPHAGVEEPLDPIVEQHSPVYLLQEARPWLAHPDHPRRCGVSAFGFGGTNAHAVLEEYLGASREGAPGDEVWPCELFVLAAENRDALADDARCLLDALERGAEPRLRDLAFSYASRADEIRRGPNLCLTIVSEGLTQLRSDLKLALSVLRDGGGAQLPPHISIKEDADVAPQPLAFIFPGQGAQYPNMAREVAMYFNEMRGALESADVHLRAHYPQLLSRYIYPPASFSEAELRGYEQELTDTHAAQPAIGVVSLGFLEIARRLRLSPAMLCGHSYGEYTALYAASALSREDFLALSEARGRVMGTDAADGTMAVVRAPRAEVAARLSECEAVVVANDNAPRQTVISGPRAEVIAVVERLNAAGIVSRLLPVSGPFHSPLMTPAKEPLSAAIDAVEWSRPLLPVYSNVTAQPYEADADAVRRQVSRHLLSPVEFVGQVERMYEDGARIFLELGPKNILTGLVDQILEGREHLAVSVEGRGGGMRGLLGALGALVARGTEVNLPALFAGRDVKRLDLHRLVETTKRPAPPPHAWIVNGAGARPQSESAARSGRLPLLTRDSLNNASPSSQDTAPMSQDTTPTAAATKLAPLPAPSPQGETHPLAIPAPVHTNEGHLLAAYQAYQETMRQFLTLQEDALKHFLNPQQPMANVAARTSAEALPTVSPLAGAARANGNGNGGGPATHIANAPTQAVQPSGDGHAEPLAGTHTAARDIQPEESPRPAFDRASLIQAIVRIVSERTGYPDEMLGLELDLEAELGIDSIKRIEILEELQHKLPAPLAAGMQARMEQLTRVKSLNDLVGILLHEGTEDRSPAAPEPQRAIPVPPSQAHAEHEPAESRGEPGGALAADEGAEFSACPRSIIEAQEEALPDHEPEALEGLFLITEDRLAVAEHVAESLRERGARAAVISCATLATPSDLERHVVELQRLNGPVKGIVHLAPLEATELPATLSAWRVYTQVHAKSLFQLLRRCAVQNAAEAGPSALRVLSASLLGGLFGRDGNASPGLPTGGSGYGILKSLEVEWPGVIARAIDFDQTLTAREVARRIVSELTAPAGSLEVGYPAGRRTIFRTVSAPLDVDSAPPRLKPEADWVVLATGGARGITAEVARAFAVPGMRMIVVGRAPEPQAEGVATAGVEDVAALRGIFIERAKSGGGDLTPAKIEAQVNGLLRQRAISRNLRQLAGAGVQVEYHALDVRDEEAFGGLLKQTYARYGRLDAVLHGAGVIEDKLLRDKSPDSFDRVFDTKVDSTFILSRHLEPATLQLLVFFSSVAGRYGNRGQSDYAAANEVMSRFAWRLASEFPRARVLAIDWGPWAAAGMASAAVNQQFRDRGVIPIQTRAGCGFLMDEIMYGARSEVEVVAGEGPWTSPEPVGGDELSDLLLNIGTLTENFWMM